MFWEICTKIFLILFACISIFCIVKLINNFRKIDKILKNEEE